MPTRLLTTLLLFALLTGAGAGAAQTPGLPTVQLAAGIHLITAELAASDPARARGLMFRQGLPANHGMLFVFDRKATHCMWMRNTLIPLSVAFIEDDGTIVNIENMQPHDERTRHCARRPVRFALEMALGWFDGKGIGPGAKLGRLPAVPQ
ncbi:MAG: DUF192 domain-containing protein [Burkholderiales bacterium]|jgi:hypothetical protein|nr:DUF192 domain-containing protein [Burkholderiales bacterium]